MANTCDVIVVGLGAMGSATLHQLARRGVRALGIEQFSPGHDRGSSHGRSRIIREAYFEDPRYVPLVQRAYELWAELERDSGVPLLRQTGGLMLGAPDSTVVRGAKLSAELHGLPHAYLHAPAIRERFPAFRARPHDVGVFEPRAGVLAPETAITTFIARAEQLGATVRRDEAMQSFRTTGDGVEVTTSAGVYRASRLVLSVGAWVGAVLRELALPFVVQRNVLYWFDASRNPAQFSPATFPVFIHEISDTLAFYGSPDTGDGIKLALHHHGETTDPDHLRRTVSDAEIAFVRSVIAEYIPDANGTLRSAAACMYTNLPDDHFIIDTHPSHPAVIVASPCSGHGFKFSSAIGEVLADMATDRPARFDISLFALSRFVSASQR
jgi:sarcosine oxidase